MANEYQLSYTAEEIDRKLNYVIIGKDETGITTTNPYDGSPIYIRIKTNGEIAIVKIMWMLLSVQKCNKEKAIFVIDNTNPHFELLYNVLSREYIPLFTQYAAVNGNNYLFKCSYSFNTEKITFNIFAPENINLTGTNYIGATTINFTI